MSDEVTAFKEGQRAMWNLGNYDVAAERIWAVGERLVDRAAIGAGMDVLDVAAGTGNVSIRAAATGAKVTASDLTPELFEAGRRRADAAGVELEWIEADAEALPFEDARFDAVLSTFGVMFAPRHDVAAGEFVRVAKPGAVLGICAWRPSGAVGRMFTTLGGHLGPPPPFAGIPVQWGDEDHVRELFEPHGIRLEFEEQAVEFAFDSMDEAVGFIEENLGPVIVAKQNLDEEAYSKLRADLVGTYEAVNTRSDGTVAYEATYLMTIGRKPG